FKYARAYYAFDIPTGLEIDKIFYLNLYRLMENMLLFLYCFCRKSEIYAFLFKNHYPRSKQSEFLHKYLLIN
uniref:hypothetical protein n=1 Tax=Acidiplasma sp. TaxID=1872114 RepID=UPI00258A1C10